jgi:transposase
MSAAYRDPTDVTDAPWDMRQSLLPERTWRPGGPGRPPGDLRRIVNGILYVNKTGCPWRLVPKAWGQGNTIDGSGQRWRRDGVWARVRETLRPWERRGLGRKPEPSAGSLDSQRIKTAPQHEDIGLDGHKKITGRTRQIVVDTLGLLIAVVVTDAGTDDRLGLVEVCAQYVAEGVKRRRNIGGEGASPAEWLEEGGRGLTQTHTIDLAATTNQEGKGFHVMPWRWAVERTCAWVRNDRRHRRDDERVTANSAALIQMSMIRLRLNRLA